MNKFISLIFLSFIIIATHAQDYDEIKLEMLTVENIAQIDQLATFELSNLIAMDWSETGDQLVLSNYDGVWLLDLDNMDIQQIESVDFTVYDIAFVDDTQVIAFTDLSELYLYDLSSNSLSTIIYESEDIRTISDDGLLYSSTIIDYDAELEAVTSILVKVYSMVSKTLLFETSVSFYDEYCYYSCGVGLNYSPDNSQLFIRSFTPEVKSSLVDITTSDNSYLSDTGHVSADYSPDGSLIASAVGKSGYIADQLVIIDSETVEMVTQLQLYSSSFPDFNSLGDLIAISVYDENAPNPDEASGFIYFFDTHLLLSDTSIEPVLMFPFNRPPVLVRFSPNGRMLAVSDGSNKLSLWGVSSVDE